ncbi:uncharacterized protein [Temnothorax nylanderi]|uniref:uncharacterized protein n=1 Tax=Temnothorax nylanderi TaxID=102681 RepID=UPI003A8A4ED4
MSAKMNVEIIADKPYAVIELPSRDDDELKSTVNYAVPACTAWLQNITIKVAKDDKQGRVTRVTYAAICRWPLDESKLSDYLEKKKKPTDTWVTYENVKILKFCKSVRQAKEEAEKALDVSDLSQSEKDNSVKRQRFVTRRYSPARPAINKTSSNRRKNSNIVYVKHSDSSDFEYNAPAVRNLKITKNY